MAGGQIDDVIRGGYCIGCGGCAAAAPSHFQLRHSSHGTFQAGIIGNPAAGQLAEVSRSCPFSDASADEDGIGGDLFGAQGALDANIGWYRSTWAARAVSPDLYNPGTSGGIVRWLCSRLLQDGHIDGAVMVTQTKAAPETGSPLFGYSICTTAEQIAAASRSAYYPIAADGVFTEMAARGGRYVFVGTPCFVKAARLLALANPDFARTLRFCVAIFCGHLKSSFFGEVIARQVGMEMRGVASMDFRHRVPGAPATSVAVSMRNAAGLHTRAYYRDLFGTDYGHGFFKYKACDYCDDIVGELGDVSVGDAWLPQYLQKGTSAVVVRTPFLEDLFRQAVGSGEIWAEPLTPQAVAASQEANFRHRRDGLRYRLWKAFRHGHWAPRKRVAPNRSHLTPRERHVFDLRERLREWSFTHWLACRTRPDAVATFISMVRPLTLRLDYFASRNPRERLTRLSFRILNRLALLDVAKSCLRFRKRRRARFHQPAA